MDMLDMPEFETNIRIIEDDEFKMDKVDFILAYNIKRMKGDNLRKLKTFLAHLEYDDFMLETELFAGDENICFIKIFASKWVILDFADVFSIDIAYRNLTYKYLRKYPFRWMRTELINVSFGSPLFQRAQDAFNDAPPKDLTSAEKALVTYKNLTFKHFGSRLEERGIEKLLHKGILEAAFPVHDGPHEWQEDEPLNDLQLLSRYWGNLKYCYKYQPLDLIQRYYGPEITFYFAWLGHYNKLLIPAAIMGVICFVLGACTFRGSFDIRNREICNSDKVLCPRCYMKTCQYEYLKNSCVYAKLMTMLDNPITVLFAALTSIWATIYIETWKREEAVLKVMWNLRKIELDVSMRPEFEENTPYKTFSPVTGVLEPYIPLRVLLYHYTVTFSIILLLILVVLLALFGVMVYNKVISVVMIKHSNSEFVLNNISMIAALTGSTISVTFIVLFDLIYHRIARWLTSLENPRTQIDFDNSYIYKSYVLAFINNYAVTFYIAFMKGNFYTYPGDKEIFSQMAGVQSDLCAPLGCIIDLTIQLFFVMVIKNILSNIQQYLLPLLIKLAMKFMKEKKNTDYHNLPQWQKDYLRIPFIKDYIIREYIQMMIQYGYVLFFIACFPFTPLFALLNNTVELRVDAMKFVRNYQRPVPFKLAGLGAWNGILQAITYIGIMTNALVIAFTSEFIPREMFRYNIDSSLSGFIDSRLSEFDTSELPQEFTSNVNVHVNVCYYPGTRNPSDHPARYKIKDEYWYELTIKLLSVIVFEHLLLFVTGLIAYAVPDIPLSVKEQMNLEKNQYKELRIKILTESYVNGRKKREKKAKESKKRSQSPE